MSQRKDLNTGAQNVFNGPDNLDCQFHVTIDLQLFLGTKVFDRSHAAEYLNWITTVCIVKIINIHHTIPIISPIIGVKEKIRVQLFSSKIL